MQEKSEIFILGSPKILIFGESVEQGVVLYKCRARSRTSLSLSECSIFPIGISSVLCRGYCLCNTHLKMFNFSFLQITDDLPIKSRSSFWVRIIILRNSKFEIRKFFFYNFSLLLSFYTFSFCLWCPKSGHGYNDKIIKTC